MVGRSSSDHSYWGGEVGGADRESGEEGSCCANQLEHCYSWRLRVGVEIDADC